jgi:hypothetical protein
MQTMCLQVITGGGNLLINLHTLNKKYGVSLRFLKFYFTQY